MTGFEKWSDEMLRRVHRRAGARREAGFTLIELMIVITIILILLNIAVPRYQESVARAKEAVLRDDLFTLRSLIDEYTLDRQEAPQSLQDLVDHGYLRQIPIDPFTGSASTWIEVREDDTITSLDQKLAGIIDVRSGSNRKSLSGEEYSSW